jgi:hypothetical protein
MSFEDRVEMISDICWYRPRLVEYAVAVDFIQYE